LSGRLVNVLGGGGGCGSAPVSRGGFREFGDRGEQE
jgi:hypothetical protein